MKILYHHRTASRDGQAVHIEEMINGLRSLGHEVHVVAPAVSRQGVMGAKVGWVHRLKGSFPPPLYEVMELAYSVVEYRRLARAVREFQPQVIYERYNLFLMAGLMAKRRFRLPLLLEVNSPLAHERDRFGGLSMKRLARWAEGAVWRGADQVLPVTRVLAGYVTAYGVPKDRVTVVSNGVNEAHFIGAASVQAAKAALQLSDKLVLGFTGFLRDWHGVDQVIQWMAQPSVPAAVHLLIVGDGPARPRLERLAAEHGLGDRVTFTGVVSREQIPDHVAAFDVALQPAVVPYASPLKLFEYLALGKAIVAPRQANLEEVLTDGRNALFFDPADPNGFSNALTRIVADRRLRDALAAGAAASIHEQRLTWLDQAKRVSALCARFARGHGAGRDEETAGEAVARGGCVMQAAKRDVPRTKDIPSERVR
ncbi:MAG: glycosyltransferase family 4 protein [Betaproteobacteria bacterium]|nr:glycosyltransferase family 4 protein [Betaproteobacteria bacterium]